MKFPGIPDTFPESGANFADFGHNLRFSGFMREKFAAKFAEAGNLKLQDVSQFLPSSLPRSGLDIGRLPQHFSAGCEAGAASTRTLHPSATAGRH